MHEKMLEILSRLQGELIAVKVIPDLIQYFMLARWRGRIRRAADHQHVEPPVSGINAALKRLMDLGVSGLVLAVVGRC
jgi:hypothetical protein